MKVLGCLFLIFCLAVAGQTGNPQDMSQRKQKKSKKKEDIEPITQVLPLPKDLPAAIVAETQRLVFHVSPLSTKGLLTQQTRDAVKALWGQTKSAQIVRLRAFVAGSGDSRRVATIVSEMFTEKHLPLPVLTTVLVGSLGMEGAQILIEATSVDRKVVNPNGLLFISGKGGTGYAKAIQELQQAVQAMGGTAADIVRTTCYVNGFDTDGVERAKAGMGTYTVVQMRREPSPIVAECEAIARNPKPQAEPLKLVNPPVFQASPNYSQIAVVTAPKIVFTGLQLAFRTQEADFKLAFERLGRTLEGQGIGFGKVFFTSYYALSQQSIDGIRAVRFGFLDKAAPPAATLVPFEGLPSLDASFGVDVVALAAP